MTKDEPTITDVMGVVNGLAVSVQDLTEAVQTGFQKMEERFEKNDSAHVSLFEGQRQTIELLNERTTVIDKRVSKVQNRVEDVVNVLEKAAKKVPSFDVTQLLYENK